MSLSYRVVHSLPNPYEIGAPQAQSTVRYLRRFVDDSVHVVAKPIPLDAILFVNILSLSAHVFAGITYGFSACRVVSCSILLTHIIAAVGHSHDTYC